MKRSILFVIMSMCMISVSAFAVDYSHDKSPPGIEVYDGIQADVIDIEMIQEKAELHPALVIQAIYLIDVQVPEVVYIGDFPNEINLVLSSELTNTKLLNIARHQTEGLIMQTQGKYNQYSMLG